LKHAHEENQTEKPRRTVCSAKRSVVFKLAALGLVVVSALAGTGLARWLREPAEPVPTPSDHPKALEGNQLDPVLFRNWPAPDLALLLSASQHGYMLPCGCSEPQLGGLERRYNFLQMLKAKGWPVAALDLGDVPQKEAPVKHLQNLQGLIKYRYSMQALKKMEYLAVGIGEFDLSLSLTEYLAAYALQENDPKVTRVLSANLHERDKTGLGVVYDWTETTPAGSNIKVGVTSIMGTNLAKMVKDPDAKFTIPDVPIRAVLKEMAARQVELRVLLYHGHATSGLTGEPGEAVALAKAFPQFQLILCLDADEPSINPIMVAHENTRAQTMIVSLGHKGKSVGVVGVKKPANPGEPLELRYQLAEMTETYKTRPEKVKGHPILDLMEDYTRELKEGNGGQPYLLRYAQSKHPLQVDPPGETPTFVGSQACKKCHEGAYDIWTNTPHSHAYEKLVVKAKQPSLRQYDPECIVCHTVGFGYQSGFVTEEKTPKLTGVGCESCHGPGSEHARHPNNTAWYKLMNPWKAPENEKAEEKKARILRIDKFCQGCHDIDNDVHWAHGGFERKWPKIAHPTIPE
jgi:hypothetical protein